MVALCLSGFARSALAVTPSAATLSWVRETGAEACPAEAPIAAEVDRLLGGPALVPRAHAELVVEGRVSARKGAGASFETTLTLVDRAGRILGQRQLTTPGPTCDTLVGEVGLVIALMVDPNVMARAPASGPSRPGAPSASTPDPERRGASVTASSAPPLPPTLAPAPCASSPRISPCPPAVQPQPWRTQISLGPLLGLGLLPSPAVGVRLRGGMTPPGLFPFELGADLFLPVRASPVGVGPEMALSQAHVGACPLNGSHSLWGLSACGGVDLGILRMGQANLPVSRTAEVLMVQGTLGGRVLLRLAQVFRVSIGLDMAVPFVRARVTYTGPDGTRLGLFTTAPITGMADMGVGLEL